MASSASVCRYHPESPSRWHCPDCDIHFCSRCIQPNDSNQAFCPVCDLLLQKHEFTAIIPPFWKRLPAAFLYPLNLASLMFLAIISLVSLLQLVPLGGIIVAILLPFMIMKYAFQVLQHTAVGHMSPPLGSTSMSGQDFALPVKSYLLIILLSALVGLSSFLGLFGIIISVVLFTLLFPVMIMILGVQQQFFQALNPKEIIEMIQTIGASYFGLVGMLFLLISASSSLFYMFGEFIPLGNKLVLFVIANFVSSYYTVLMFHLMGYVIYQFHEDLGIKSEVEFEVGGKKKKTQAPLGQTPVSKASLLIQEGHPEIAKPFIRKHLSVELTAEQIQLHELYIKLLKQLDEHEELIRIASDYILSLMEHGHGKKALQTFRLCHELDASFQVNHAQHTHSMIQAAHKASDFDLLLALAQNFAKRHPEYDKLFEVYLVVARVLHEHFKRDQQAAAILKSLVQKFPKHESIQRAKMALARIKPAAGASQ